MWRNDQECIARDGEHNVSTTQDIISSMAEGKTSVLAWLAGRRGYTPIIPVAGHRGGNINPNVFGEEMKNKKEKPRSYG